MKPRLLIDSAVLEFIGRLRKRDRAFLLGRFEAIREFPGRHTDYRTADETGRELDGISQAGLPSSFATISPTGM